eukprot:g50.t1
MVFEVELQVRVKPGQPPRPVVLEMHPEWAPVGVERFKQLVESGFYSNARFHRVIPDFIAQVGIAADPAVYAKWGNSPIKDDAETHLGERATWVGQSPSWWLDHLQVIDELVVPSGKGPDQPTLKEQGNAYLDKAFPELSEIVEAKVLHWDRKGCKEPGKCQERAYQRMVDGVAPLTGRTKTQPLPHQQGLRFATNFGTQVIVAFIGAFLLGYYFVETFVAPESFNAKVIAGAGCSFATLLLETMLLVVHEQKQSMVEKKREKETQKSQKSFRSLGTSWHHLGVNHPKAARASANAVGEDLFQAAFEGRPESRSRSEGRVHNRCLFELAAFLKSRSSQSKKLTIQPTFSGPCSLCAFITMFAAALPFTAVPMENQVRLWVVYPLFTVCGSITGYVAILAFRGYFRSIGILEGEVLEALVCDLRYSVFTRSWTICIASPVLWASLDLAATWVAIGVWSKAIAWLWENTEDHDQQSLITQIIVAASSGTFSGHSGHVDPQLEELAAEAVARMDLVSSEVLRTTSANNALGALTLSEANEGDLYHKSRPSSRIGNFWSHSWHGGRWNKIWTLLVLYNGRAAICCGFIVSFIMMLLFALGFLPGFEKNQYLERTSVWGLGSGSLAALVTLIIWRPRHRVFLDRICINQHDSKLKAAAICSLAGMLKRSEKMLVLWDPTWSERLWCLFELAAFLKSKSENEQHALTIRPSLVGPSSTISFSVMVVTVAPLVLVPNDAENHQHILLIIFLMGSLAGLFMVSVLRGYFRSLALLEQQLNSVNFDKTRSHCCEVNHREGQETILCDRRIVKACVSKWFGSEKAFEECIRSEVMQAVITSPRFHPSTVLDD